MSEFKDAASKYSSLDVDVNRDGSIDFGMSGLVYMQDEYLSMSLTFEQVKELYRLIGSHIEMREGANEVR